jgi:hypothetical protein
VIAEWEPEQHTDAALEVHSAKAQAWGWFGAVVIGVAMLLMAFAAGARWLDATRWDPLGEYPVQTVFTGPSLPAALPPVGSQSGSGLPTFRLDENISVFGTKCVKSAEDTGTMDGIVTVTGDMSWVSNSPSGTIIPVAKGGGERGPGCVASTFSNPIPDKVREHILRLAEEGVYTTDWHLTGTETPVRGTGDSEEPGVSRTWISTNFRVIVEAP